MAESNALLIAVVALVAVIGILGLLALNAATTASTSVLASIAESPSGPEKPSPALPECKAYCWKQIGNNVVTISLCHIPDEQRGTVASHLSNAGFNCVGVALPAPPTK